jgi:hypothetical protein
VTPSNFESFLKAVRTWTGFGLMALLAIQIVTGYSLVGKIYFNFIPYQWTYFVHTKFSWVLIYFFLTFVTVNLYLIIRRHWRGQEAVLMGGLIMLYILAILTTLYLQFFK